MDQKLNIQPYLEDLERRINPDQELQNEKQWLNFADGHCESEYFAPSRVPSMSEIEWPHVMVNDGLVDYDLMILQQLSACSATLEKGGGEMLGLRSNYGTGIIPTMLGAEPFMMPYKTNTLPGSRPFPGGRTELMQIIDEGKVDYSKGLARDVFNMAERYLELITPFPKLQRFLHYYNPDLQGPLSLVEATWGSDVYADIFDEEDDVCKALDFYTDLYISFTRRWKELCPDFDDEHAMEWGLLHRGGTIIRNDAAMNISGTLYKELVRPRDQRIIDEFGGCIHFCGKGHHYIKEVSDIRGLSGINMSQPDWNDMEVIYQNTIDKGLTIIGMPAEEVERASKEGRPLRGLVHCGASVAAWKKN